MLLPALLLSAIVGARPDDVSAETNKLLVTFREEFVERARRQVLDIRHGRSPSSFSMSARLLVSVAYLLRSADWGKLHG